MCKAIDDLIMRGEKRGEQCGEQKMMRLVKCMSEDGALEAVPRLASEPLFYKEMLAKYHIEENEILK